MPGEIVLTASAYGHTVGLRITTGDLEAVRPWLPHWWDDGAANLIGEPESIWTIEADSSPEVVIADLELWVAEHAVDRVFVHAGVVAVDGRALLLPGRSFTGKSTMTRELLRAGARYGSDEYAVLRADGTVEAYPRPLAMRGASARRVPHDEIGATAFDGALPVHAVAALRYDRSATPDVRPMSAATAVLRLFDNTVCASTRPAESFETLVALSDGIAAVEGIRGEAHDEAPRLLDLLRDEDVR